MLLNMGPSTVALVYGFPALLFGGVWLFAPQFRGARLYMSWLGVTIVVALTFNLVGLLVHPCR
jgi:hypothetical protein